jgi:hypothetical protein
MKLCTAPSGKEPVTVPGNALCIVSTSSEFHAPHFRVFVYMAKKYASMFCLATIDRSNSTAVSILGTVFLGQP